MTFVPLPVAAVAGTVRIQRGETLAGLCSRLGQPLHAYRELVGANLHYPMTGEGVPAGCSVVFSDLSEGDELYVPASWQPRGSHLGGLEGAPGMLGDAVQDSFVASFPYNPQSGLSKASYDENVHVVTSWWRDDHKDGALPQNANDWAPYATAAAAWWKNVGSQLKPGYAKAIDFGATPWFQLFQLAKQDVSLVKSLLSVDRAKVNAALEHFVSPGQFPKPGWKPVFWRNLNEQSFQGFKQIGWMAPTWAQTAGIRWDLLPFDQINWAGAPKGDLTNWIIGEVKRLTGQPAASGDIQIDLLSCGPGKISVAGKCYGYAGPANPLTGCPAGSVQYMGHCIQTDCKPGDTAEITPAGVVCTPPGGGGSVPPTDKPCPPQGVKKPDGSCDCKEKMGPTAELDDKLWLCVDCGPNATHKPGTTDCDCLPGYVPHPSGAEGSGCVKAGDTGGGKTDNKAIEKPSAGGWSTGEKAIAALVGVAAAFGLAKAAKVF